MLQELDSLPQRLEETISFNLQPPGLITPGPFVLEFLACILLCTCFKKSFLISYLVTVKYC